MDAGFDVGGGKGGGGVDMGQKAKGWALGCGGDGGQHHAVIGKGHILRAHGGEFIAQQGEHAKLDMGGGGRGAVFVALTVNCCITRQSGFKFGVKLGHDGLRIWGECRGRAQGSQRAD